MVPCRGKLRRREIFTEPFDFSENEATSQFMSRKYFGTDGVRGPYGSATMNEDFAWRLGAAAARYAKSQSDFKSPQVFIGRDTRASGPSLDSALAGGLQS